MVTTVLYGKDTLQMGEVESTLLSYQKTNKKVEDNSGSALVAYSQNRRGRNAVKVSNSRGRSKFKDCEGSLVLQVQRVGTHKAGLSDLG